ncbi:glycosyltransferase family 4 protein [Ideonella livida]|uniref:Glycosyltransferase family 4 protein n=1 Tax=Ideonella livida TaxID=2707176 RepID=A0A7C9PKL5_9BURK|nr:glycosyltransferase family 4 protein [Ideonella livida]NDY93432.1 glycosyltransferase family 4 protein [Ideonella livida]
MNILYLNHYAGSPALGMEYRPYYLAREWVRMGHEVQMVAATYSHVRARQPVAGPERVDGIDYLWVDTPAYQGNGLGRVRNIWAFLRRVWAQAPALVARQRPDIVIASSTYPMDIWVARRIARLAGAVLVHEVHDLWPLSPIELSGMSPGHPFARLCAWAEKTACRDADLVVSMLPKVHQHMAERGLDLRKLAIVPNGIDPAEWQAAPAPLREDVAATLAVARARGHLVVGYAGSMGRPNALDVLVEAADRLRYEPVSFVLVGDGHERERLVGRIHEELLERVHWLAPIPKAQIPAFLAELDVAYIGWQRVPIYRFGIAPNKLMDYMMAGCTVLHAVEAGNDPVAESGCGLTVAPESPDAVADGLRRLSHMSHRERAEMGQRGTAFVQAHHTYPVLARRFLQACEPALARRRAL